MAYTEVKQVRAMNGQQFINDFRRLRSIVAWCHNTEETFEVPRWEVWRRAKVKKLHYIISTKVYANEREVLVIT